MRRLFIALTLLVSSVGTSAKSPPDVRTGTNTNRDTSQPMHTAGLANREQMDVQPTDEALAVGRSMARCAVSQHSDKVKVALAAATVDEFLKATRKIKESLEDCMAYGGRNLADFSRFEFGPSSLAGLLSEAMLARNGMPALASAKYDANAPKLDQMAGSAASLVQLRLGECLAMTQPAALGAFVASAPSSPQELAAFQALLPAIPTCLDKNVTLKATRSSLRLASAFALYRRTVEPSASGATN